MFLFLPIGDHPNPPRAQWITRILIGLNIAAYIFIAQPYSKQGVTRLYRTDLAARNDLDEMWRASQGVSGSEEKADYGWLTQVSRYDLFIWRYGYVPGHPSLLALFACMFLHAGFLHLAGNMLYLWIFGDNVEARLGPLGYLLAYFGTGAFATLAFALLNRGSMTPLVGASGAISGVLGFYLVWFPHNQIRVFVWFIFFIQIFYISALWVLGAFFVFDNLLPLLMSHRGGGGVAFAAHLGGFLMGAAAAFFLARMRGWQLGPRPQAVPGWRPRQIYQEPAKVREDPGRLFASAVAEGNMREAAQCFARVVREGGGRPDPAQVFELGRWLYDRGLVPDAAAVFRFYIRNYPRGADLDRVHLGLGILLARKMGHPVGAREHLLAAIDLAPPGSALAAAAREELERIGG